MKYFWESNLYQGLQQTDPSLKTHLPNKMNSSAIEWKKLKEFLFHLLEGDFWDGITG